MMGRKLVDAVVVIVIMVAIIGLMTVMATGCGVLDDFGNFGGDDDGDGTSQTPSKRPPPTIQPFNPSKKAV